MTDERKKKFFAPICLGFLNNFSPLVLDIYHRLRSSYIITVESERTERERERESDVCVVRILIIY